MFNEINSFLNKWDRKKNDPIISKLQGLGVASGVVVLPVGAGAQTTRTIVDVTMAAADTIFSITHGIGGDPQSWNLSNKSVSTALPFVNITRTSATVIAVNKTNLAASDSVFRVELALPSTIS
jgi:hypothetical protein